MNSEPDKKLTMPLSGLILTIAVIILGIWDLVAVLINGVGGSISQFLVIHGVHAPVLVFAFGFIAGHLFGNMSLEK